MSKQIYPESITGKGADWAAPQRGRVGFARAAV
jgi:hypothetical protein